MPEHVAPTPERQPHPFGTELADARKKARMTVEQVSAITKIRAGLIREIEAGDFRGCGGAIYARGHLRAIAAAIGVDPAPLVAAFEAKYGVPEDRPVPGKLLSADPVALREFRERRGTRWLVPMVLAAASLTVIAAISLATTSKPAGDRVIVGNQAVGGSPSPLVTTPQSVEPSPLLAYSGVVVHIVIRLQPSWVHVEDANRQVLFEGVLTPGDSKDFRSATALKVVLGNAGAVDLTVNGHHLGVPDAFGKVFRTTFTAGDPALGSGA